MGGRARLEYLSRGTRLPSYALSTACLHERHGATFPALKGTFHVATPGAESAVYGYLVVK